MVAAMAPLRPPAQHWADPIAAVIPQYWDGAVSIYSGAGAPGDYDPKTGELSGDERGTPLIANRLADVLPFRAARDVPTSGTWGTKRQVRFKMLAEPDDPFLEPGSLVVVDDGGTTPNLVGLVVIVQSAINSSHAALWTIEGISEFRKPVTP